MLGCSACRDGGAFKDPLFLLLVVYFPPAFSPICVGVCGFLPDHDDQRKREKIFPFVVQSDLTFFFCFQDVFLKKKNLSHRKIMFLQNVTQMCLLLASPATHVSYPYICKKKISSLIEAFILVARAASSLSLLLPPCFKNLGERMWGRGRRLGGLLNQQEMFPFSNEGVDFPTSTRAAPPAAPKCL